MTRVQTPRVNFEIFIEIIDLKKMLNNIWYNIFQVTLFNKIVL